MPNKKTGKTIKCLACGKEVYMPLAQFLRCKNHYCSLGCLSRFTAKIRSEKLRKKDYPIKVGVCIRCGKDIIAINAGFDKPNRKYCSYSCKLAQQNTERVWTTEQRNNISKKNTRHGISKSSLYNVWDSMRSRCYNRSSTSYYNYGGRGIVVCDEWLDSVKFFQWAKQSGYKKGLYIDRIDNTKGYYPENCQWVTPKESVANRRPKVEWHKPKTIVDKRKVMSLRKKGKTYKEIGKAVDCSATNAHRIVKAYKKHLN